MPEIILHQYPMSPFSEKVRKIFAVKRLAWRAVEQPMWNPKPKLIALTGGYRRIPVMQIGADIYCDTACIVREIEARYPEPSIYAGNRGAAEAIAWWADRQFFVAAAGLVLVTVGPTLPPEFKADREKMVPGLQIDALAAQAPHAKNQFRAYCQALEHQLAGHPYLLGSAFSLADASCFHTLWFARMDPGAAATMGTFPALGAWFARIDGLGHGDARPLNADEALAIAARSESVTAVREDPADPNGLRPGNRVTVTPDDYALDPVAGEVVALSSTDVAIRRRDAQVGDVVVHFPRAGFRIAPA